VIVIEREVKREKDRGRDHDPRLRIAFTKLWIVKDGLVWCWGSDGMGGWTSACLLLSVERASFVLSSEGGIGIGVWRFMA